MSKRLSKKVSTSLQRHNRVRAKVVGTAERPRLAVSISNLHVTAQVIDDSTHKTLCYSTTVGNKNAKGTKTEKAELIGKDIADKAKKLKIKSVVFDRGSRIYHGRVAALADAARQSGLEF